MIVCTPSLCLSFIAFTLSTSVGLLIETSVNAEAAAFLDSSEASSIEETSDDLTLTRSSLIAEGLGVLWSPPAIRAIVQARLKQVTCDGETILVTLPIDHRIGTTAESLALGICSR
jgi:hypothetical protein